MTYFNPYQSRSQTNVVEPIHDTDSTLYYIFLDNPGSQEAFIHYWSFPVQPDPATVPPLFSIRVDARSERVIPFNNPISVAFPGWCYATNDIDPTGGGAPQSPQIVLVSYL